jgi:antiphage defense system Thoeris ThsB-like protein
MARHELSVEEQLEGVRAALRSSQTPPQLREGLRRREAQLEEQLTKRSVFKNLFGGQQRSKAMAKTRLFISFDYDHDEDLRNLLAGQAKHPDTPFDIYDRSLKEPLTGDWKEKFRQRLRNVDQMVVICGEQTHLARGVGQEVQIAQEERKPYFLLNGRSGKNCTKPTTARSTDKVYDWTWDNLKALIAGGR